MSSRLLIGVLLLGFSNSAFAQRVPEPLMAALARLRPDDRVRVALGGAQWTGRFQKVLGDSLFLVSANSPPKVIRFHAIDTLWRRASRAGRGAQIGAITGGALGGLMGLSLLGVSKEGAATTVGENLSYFGIGAIVGSVPGAVIGSLVGAPFRRWDQVYPRTAEEGR